MAPRSRRARKGKKSDNVRSCSSSKNERQRVFITHIRATNVVSGLSRQPEGYYVAVKVNGKTKTSSIRPALVAKDVVEWDEEILLPSERSHVISFKIYANFELGSKARNDELLRQFEITAGDVLGSSQQFRPDGNLQNEVSPSCSYLQIIIQRGVCGANQSSMILDLLNLEAVSQLVQLTDNGHRALVRYNQLQNHRELDEAIMYFELARGLSPLHHPNHSDVLFNLATAKFVHCRDNDLYSALHVPVTLYQDALRIRTSNHADHTVTGLDLCFALLGRLQRQGDETNRSVAKDLLSGTVKNCAFRVAWFALQMAGIFVSVRSTRTQPRASQSSGAGLHDWVIRNARADLALSSNRDSNRPMYLAAIGTSLFCRFQSNGRLEDLNEAISMLENAIQLTPDEDPDRRDLLNNLGAAFSCRFGHLGDHVDLNNSIIMLEKAMHLTPNDDPGKPDLLTNLGVSFSRRFEHLSDLADINTSISMHKEALRLRPSGHRNKPTSLHNLGHSLARRFEYLGDIDDINMSILMHEEALRLAPKGHSDRPARLDSLGTSLLLRFEHLGHLADLGKAISMQEEAVSLTPSSDSYKPDRLSNLGNSLFHRYERLGELTDVNKSISILEEAACLTPKGHSGRPAKLSNLGLSLSRRFDRLGDTADLDRSISTLDEAVRLTPNTHRNRPSELNNLGLALSTRFERLGNFADLNKSILVLEEAVHLSPDGHPGRPARLINLGSSMFDRYARLGDIADLNKYISLTEEAVHLTPDNHPDKPVWLSQLGDSLRSRFERLGDLADINRAIVIQEEALRLTPDDYPKKPGCLSSLGSSLHFRFERLGDIADLNRSIMLREEAMCLVPDGHSNKPGQLSGLGLSLSTRFEHLGDPADINMAISMQEEALRLTPVGYPEKPTRLNNLGASFFHRFEHFGDIADLNRFISLAEEAVHLTPDGHPDKPAWLGNLGNSLLPRFERLHDDSDLHMSISMQEEAVRLTPDGHPDKPIYLNNLGNSLVRRFQHIGNLEDIHRAILIYEEAVHVTPNGDPWRPARINNLGSSLLRRFECRGDLADLNKSISMQEEALRLTPDGHPDKPAWLYNLGGTLMRSFKDSQDPSRLSTAISYFSAAARASTGPTYIRFCAARSWISTAHLEDDSRAPLDAYTAALNILPELAWLGLPLAERHRLLTEATDLARDAAAAALGVGRPEKAVEWLEQGRSIVWSQFLQLRNPLDELRVTHPAAARQLEDVSRDLQQASSGQSDLANLSSRAVSFGRQVRNGHDLALRRERLLAEIRTFPGFKHFLLPKSIEQLTALVHSGPVIFLNASKHRCDALIIMPKQRNIIPVPLPGITYGGVKFVQSLLHLVLKRSHLMISRDDISSLISPEEGLTPPQSLSRLLQRDGTQRSERAARVKPQQTKEYNLDEVLQEILADLWEGVANPVLRALGLSTPQSGTEKLTHIFWCPTGPFTFLPIHAAGIYSSTKPGERLSDFAVSSYIPTLNSLAHSTQDNTRSSSIQLLAVPQPPTDGLTRLVSTENEIDHIRTLAARSPFVSIQNSDGDLSDVMEKMQECNWVHFACHGMQDPDDPLDSGLGLADQRRLKLSDIIRLARPRGGLAFLSACQTAQGDTRLAEESVHLAAGMLLAGYGGVIATMWAIRDNDAPQIAKGVYEYLFRDGMVPDSTEAGEALHYAVQGLRDSGASFSSWIPYIHVGR